VLGGNFLATLHRHEVGGALGVIELISRAEEWAAHSLSYIRLPRMMTKYRLGWLQPMHNHPEYGNCRVIMYWLLQLI
jgi:hypothetical protein